MLFNFSWVVSGKLAGAGQLGPAGYALEQDLEQLQASGVGAVVSLTEREVDRGQLAARGMPYLHLPIEDMHSPTVADVLRFLDFIDENDERGVVVHCGAGLGRTGTMLACFLVKQGWEPSRSIQEVRRLRPGSVETEQQEELVGEYGESLNQVPVDESGNESIAKS